MFVLNFLLSKRKIYLNSFTSTFISQAMGHMMWYNIHIYVYMNLTISSSSLWCVQNKSVSDQKYVLIQGEDFVEWMDIDSQRIILYVGGGDEVWPHFRKVLRRRVVKKLKFENKTTSFLTLIPINSNLAMCILLTCICNMFVCSSVSAVELMYLYIYTLYKLLILVVIISSSAGRHIRFQVDGGTSSWDQNRTDLCKGKRKWREFHVCKEMMKYI